MLRVFYIHENLSEYSERYPYRVEPGWPFPFTLCTKSCTSEDGTQASLPNGIQLSCVVPEQMGLRVTKLGQRSRGVQEH